MKFNAGSKVAPIPGDFPIIQLITPGHAAHARMLYSESFNEHFYKPYKRAIALSVIAVGLVITFVPSLTIYSFSKLGVMFGGGEVSVDDSINAQNRYEGSERITSALNVASRGQTQVYVLDAQDKKLDGLKAVGISSSYQEIKKFADDTVISLNSGKSVTCLKTEDLTSKPWHNQFDFEMPMCSMVFDSPTPHQYVYSVYHSRFNEQEGDYDTKPWLGLFYKSDGKWSYTPIDLSGRSSLSGHGDVGIFDVYASLIADFPADKKFTGKN